MQGRIQFRVNDEEAEAIRETAELLGMGVGEYLRMIVLGENAQHRNKIEAAGLGRRGL